MRSPHLYAALRVAPRAIVVLIGLILFHALSGDPIASWPMIGVAVFSLLARATGSIRNRITRVELSIAASICALLFIHGGNAALYADPSLLVILPTLAWVTCLTLINFLFPLLRFPFASFLILAFFGILRLIEPGHRSSFGSELQSGLLLVLAWELLSASIVSKRESPSLLEVGGTLALLLLYYYRTSDFTIALAGLLPLLVAYFIGTSMRVHSESPEYHYIGAVQSANDSKTLNRRRRSHAFLVLTGFALLFTTAFTLSRQSDTQSFLASLQLPAQPLEIETRDRSAQIEAAIIEAATQAPDLLTNEDIARAKREAKAAEAKPPPPRKRRVIVRHIGDDKNDASYLNTAHDAEPPITSSFSPSPPALNLSAPQSTLSLPGVSSPAEVATRMEEVDTDTTSSIPLSYEFDTPSSDPSERPPGVDNIEDGSNGGDPLRVYAPPPSLASQPPIPQSEPPEDNQRNRNQSPANLPRDIQANVGFTSELQFANNVSVNLRTRPVLEVYLPESIRRPEKLYLRFNSLETLQRDRFVQRPQPAQSKYRLAQPGWNRAPEPFQSNIDSSEQWTLAMASNWSSEAPLLGPFHSLQIPANTEFAFNAAQFSMRRVAGSGPLAYRFAGVQLSDTRPATVAVISNSEQTLLTHLELSEKEIAYIRRLSSQISGRNATRVQFADRVGRYFNRRHPYQFDFAFKSSDDENLLIAWLRTRSPGICGYYAGAFTLLARAQGIPSRVVIGALSREYDGRQRKFIVRDRDAHAWAEYLNEDNQWVRADLTPFTYDTPRFAQSELPIEGFDSGILTALGTLAEPDEALPTMQGVAAMDIPTATPVTRPNESPKEEIPSTLAMLDKLLDGTPDPIVEQPQTPTPATSPAPAETALATTSAAAPPILSSRIQSPQVLPSSKSDARTNTQNPITQHPSPKNPSPNLGLYLLVALTIGFILSQIRRLFTSSRETSETDTLTRVPHERALAGKLLREIDRHQQYPQLRDPLYPLRQRALSLRYSSHCDLREVKQLKRTLARVLADAPAISQSTR